jgi:hypothetical protein
VFIHTVESAWRVTVPWNQEDEPNRTICDDLRSHTVRTVLEVEIAGIENRNVFLVERAEAQLPSSYDLYSVNRDTSARGSADGMFHIGLSCKETEAARLHTLVIILLFLSRLRQYFVLVERDVWKWCERRSVIGGKLRGVTSSTKYSPARAPFLDTSFHPTASYLPLTICRMIREVRHILVVQWRCCRGCAIRALQL